MKHGRRGLAAVLVCAAALPAAAQSRGELLYRNHCIECHTSKMHWREQRLATDWPSLVRQVARWQGEAHLNWNGDDINDVARYLNESIYRFPVEGKRAGGMGTVATAR